MQTSPIPISGAPFLAIQSCRTAVCGQINKALTIVRRCLQFDRRLVLRTGIKQIGTDMSSSGPESVCLFFAFFRNQATGPADFILPLRKIQKRMVNSGEKRQKGDDDAGEGGPGMERANVCVKSNNL